MADWWSNAFIYGINVERFCDGDGDGVGDFKGITSKIPYLADLGVTCIWLLPFYMSTGRDNGYDVTDYYQIDSRFGTFEDFHEFVRVAGERGIRVVIDFVMNHTSNRHPWFLAARQNENSRYRHYYYWSKQPSPPELGKETAFPGEESTVWTYDEVARAYYHHRFYNFEPSLNTGHPFVQAQIQAIMDFWMSFGIAGFRVDAAAIMVESSPVSDRERPEDRHDVLRKLFTDTKALREDSVLIGEVNEDPEILKKFFDGTQMNSMFNFLLNQYMILALAKQSAEPMMQVYRMLPTPKEHGHWVNFLRNLDELNIVLLPQEEHDTVYKAFAPKEDMRIYGRGIRRRLAPMLGGDTDRLKLAFSLLFSLPGSPNLVYGDEIGMGEDLSLPGRCSVRTLMQWSNKKHAGFSSSKKTKLSHAIVKAGRFDYRKVNVEDQLKDPDSLLNHIKKLAGFRKQYPWIQHDNFIIYPCDAPSVFVHGYRSAEDMLTIAHNFKNKAVKATIEVNPQSGETFTNLWDNQIYKVENGKLTVPLAPFGTCWMMSHVSGS